MHAQGTPRRPRIVMLTAWGLCLVVAEVTVLHAFGADFGTVAGYTLAFLLWLGLLAAGWRWFRRLDRSEDGPDEP
jgi:cell division protein FtsW (lipid II flippase)